MSIQFFRLAHIRNVLNVRTSGGIIGVISNYSSNPIDFPDMGPTVPVYKKKNDESIQNMKARLLYQSRKRGITENGLILSNFAAKYLNYFDEEQLNEFDNLINKPSNDWDIFYWVLEKNKTPEEYDTEVMSMLKLFAKNVNKESRYHQPDLKFEDN